MTNLVAAQAFDQAVALHRAGRHAEAEPLYRAALEADPKHFHALHFLGLVRHQRGALEEAARLLRKALNQNPASAEANNSLGLTLAALGRFAEAAARYEKAIALQPGFAKAHNNLAIALAELGRLDEAVAQYRQAIALAPDYAEAESNLGLALTALGRDAEAIAHYERALALKPDFAEAALNLGNAFLTLDQPEAALAQYERVLAISPQHARAHNNLGRAHEALNRHEAAIVCYERAVAIDPDYAGAQWNLALARLATGDLADGFRRYEWRWRNGDLVAPTLAAPLWLGTEPIAGKTILVHAEQGLGDTLFFARYLPLLADRGAAVILAAQRPLLPVLRRLAGVATLLALDEPLPRTDYHCPLASLPLAFGTTLDTIPASVPYLAADPDRTASWRAALGVGKDQRPLIGLAWAGSATNRNDRSRSLPLHHLRPLFELPGLRFVALQKELRAGDAALLQGAANVIPLGERLTDFGETAAVTALLDLVISVDTSVAHLAGALGRPVWILLPFAAEWRWLREREDSPWYPSARLFRQTAIGDWPSLVARLCDALAQVRRRG